LWTWLKWSLFKRSTRSYCTTRYVYIIQIANTNIKIKEKNFVLTNGIEILNYGKIKVKLSICTNKNYVITKGIVWFRWRGWDYTLKRALMMIKPKGLATTTATTMV